MRRKLNVAKPEKSRRPRFPSIPHFSNPRANYVLPLRKNPVLMYALSISRLFLRRFCRIFGIEPFNKSGEKGGNGDMLSAFLCLVMKGL